MNILAKPHVRYDSSNLISGLKMAFGLRIFQPSLPGFRANKFMDSAEPFRMLQRDPKLDAVFAALDSHPQMSPLNRTRAKFDIACVLTTEGIALADLTPSVLLHYSLEIKRLGLNHGGGSSGRPQPSRWRW
ncbi:hypothetical protein [Streptomyces sp. TRM49041]|uniref:hypothetical protein n=1 Tax=Streptomyces sp. TRM49041 TaxID=2603216 RepID=UPI0011ECE0AC|nr:hypothetical protein [Streptomyces sp. TRM49041]